MTQYWFYSNFVEPIAERVSGQALSCHRNKRNGQAMKLPYANTGIRAWNVTASQHHMKNILVNMQSREAHWVPKLWWERLGIAEQLLLKVPDNEVQSPGSWFWLCRSASLGSEVPPGEEPFHVK
jgi:hypothetical protein